jgi:hypothetical protein
MNTSSEIACAVLGGLLGLLAAEWTANALGSLWDRLKGS